MQPKAGERSIDDVELAKVDHTIALNADDRQHAGFTQAEIADLLRIDESTEEHELH
jgi:hypothetical protein